MHKLIKSWAFTCRILGAHCQGFLFLFFFFGISHIIKNKATNVLRRQICWDAGLERLQADLLVQLVACKCPAAVTPGLRWEWGGLRPPCDAPLVAGRL